MNPNNGQEHLLMNREAEEGLLGSVIVNPDVLPECRLVLAGGADEFYIDRNKWVWSALCSLSDQRKSIDIITLQDQVERDGYLGEIGGPAYLTGLVSTIGASYNAKEYAGIMHDYYIRRRMVAAANGIANSAYDIGRSIEEGSGSGIYELSQIAGQQTDRESMTLAEGIKIVDARIEERGQMDVLPGIPTKWIDLNTMLGGGAQDTDLLLLAGRPGQGKTSSLLEIARHGARYTIGASIYNKHVAFFSLEMPAEQLILRLISQEAEIDYQALRAGRIPGNRLTAYYSAIDTLASLSFHIVAQSGMRPSQVRARCEILAAAGRLDMICLDSLNLMRPDVKYTRLDQAVDLNAQECKNIARDFDVPFWITHQVNRGEGGDRAKRNKKPVLSDLREAGEQPADFVGFIYHEYSNPDDEVDENDLEVRASSFVIAKQRNGPVGEVPVVWRRQFSKFESAVRVQFT